jgi:Protein of unknown function (DUF3616)
VRRALCYAAFQRKVRETVMGAESHLSPSTNGRHRPLVELPVAVAEERLWLTFDTAVCGGADQINALLKNLSAIEVDGRHIWLASDEPRAVDRLTRRSPNATTIANHQRWDLGGPFDLPSKKREIDLEGMSRDNRWLWLLGSHALVRVSRDKAELDETRPSHALANMTVDKRRKTRNRCFLGRIDLRRLPGAGDTLPDTAVAKLPFTDDGNDLIELLADDDLTAPFVALPAKENGLDFEGLAVRDDMVFIGLRGPVIGGQALIVELDVRIDNGMVELRKVSGKQRYLLHAFDLQGLGIRDLAFHGNELLILAAPTMPLDGIAAVYSWRFGERNKRGGLTAMTDFQPVLRLPGGNRGDYAEGITVDGDTLLVVYDSPLPHRLKMPASVAIDRFVMP